jgi:hypothetical protein
VRNKIKIYHLAINLFTIAFFFYACSKNGNSGGGTPDPCSGVTISITAVTNSPGTIGGNDGSINASATGSTGFTYSINGGAFQASGSFAGLSAGTYTIAAKNSNGCSGSASFTVNPPPNPCTGITVLVTGSTNNPTTGGGNNGSIIAGATGGSSVFTYSINGGAFQANGTFSGLTAGNYNIIAKNATGCTGSANFILTDPCSGVTIVVTGIATNPTTTGGNNGSISVSASGASGFTYNINGGAFQSSGLFSGLVAGTYIISAKSSVNCTGSASFTLTNPNPCNGVSILVNNTFTNTVPCQAANGTINAIASGGTSPYTFSINGGLFQSSGIFSGLNTGSYIITAKDANLCTGSSSSTIIGSVIGGPLFAQVKAVLQANCVSCHNAGNANGGMNWDIDCNIVANKDRIRARAVDASPSAMPPTGLMPLSERQKIVNWINAGGRYSD